MAFELLKTAHILSAAVLFGTGLGIAFFFWMGGRSQSDEAALFAARATVIADAIFTATAVILQPVTGALLIWIAGYDPQEFWIIASILLYLLAGACWLPVVLIQLRIRDMLALKVAGGVFDERRYQRLRRTWFWLGWPAFTAVVLIIWLMVTRPGW